MAAAFVRADQVQTYTGKSCQSKHQAKTGERPAHIERRPGPVISVGWTRSVKALKVICKGRSSSAPLFALEDGLPSAPSLFLDILYCCLTACGISPMGIPAIQSDMEQPLGQLPTAQTMQPSRVLGAGAATAFDAMLTSQLLIKLRPQRQLSTQMPTNLLTSPPPPGGISDLSTCPSCVGLPLASLQPQLTTISPSGTLLAL
ncbi:uncharacterized protein UDID_18827 [Ustilago sp. UG-2017a]|nr:uncharacterized protein UDID_18827 [Ustilago sp. UG-2017a]